MGEADMGEVIQYLVRVDGLLCEAERAAREGVAELERLAEELSGRLEAELVDLARHLAERVRSEAVAQGERRAEEILREAKAYVERLRTRASERMEEAMSFLRKTVLGV